jgi:hypothetical protein
MIAYFNFQNMRILILLFTVTFLTSCNHETKKNKPSNIVNLELKIIPKSFPEAAPYPLLILNKKTDFQIFVLMTNYSTDTVRIWEENCSWGFGGLSFEFEYPSGEIQHVTHFCGAWDSNFPRTQKIPPNSSYIFSVNFMDGFWQNGPKPIVDYSKLKELNIKIKAIYEIKEDRDTKDNFVWTGSVESNTENYILFQQTIEEIEKP